MDVAAAKTAILETIETFLDTAPQIEKADVKHLTFEPEDSSGSMIVTVGERRLKVTVESLPE